MILPLRRQQLSMRTPLQSNLDTIGAIQEAGYKRGGHESKLQQLDTCAAPSLVVIWLDESTVDCDIEIDGSNI